MATSMARSVRSLVETTTTFEPRASSRSSLSRRAHVATERRNGAVDRRYEREPANVAAVAGARRRSVSGGG